MGDYATVADVTARFEGELAPDQTPWIEARIADAEALLKAKVPSLAASVLVSPVMTANARRLVVDAVLRVMRNPTGAREQTVGPFRVSYALGENAAAAVFFTDAELAVFAPRRRRFGMIGVKAGRWVS
ncbi:hypothetical protein [Nocardia sp. NPDC050435]|uniref:hypothetical protein n=1 Tax=Nocardia sp. NPDC050435 TaxID=3155040 RepID=UPI0033FA13AF